jgi:hypothetical protein
MKWKAVEFIVESTEEFEGMVVDHDFRIAHAIVEGIFANLKTKKKNVHLISVIVEEENSVFDITIDRKHFAETLEENLPYYVREERYEDCQRIADTISELKKTNISDILNQISPKK